MAGAHPPVHPTPQSLVCSDCWDKLFHHGQLWKDPESSTVRGSWDNTVVKLQSTVDQPPTDCNYCGLLLHSLSSAVTQVLEYKTKPTLRDFRFSRKRQEGQFEEFELVVDVEIPRTWQMIDRWFFFYVLDGRLAMGTENYANVNATGGMNLSVAREEAFRLARHWLDECTMQHINCPSYTPSPLPTRVIDVGGTDSIAPRLLITHGLTAPYAALSYCWGPSQQFTTTRSTISALTTSIDMAAVSSVVADAVTAARRLGLQYLWVDALCIIQDDEDDKRSEISRMRDIYKNAYCTLVIESSADAATGFLQQRTGMEFPIYRLPLLMANGAYTAVCLTPKDVHAYKPEAAVINTRAWTLEERLLSPRKLIYTAKQLRWECQCQEYQDGGLPGREEDERKVYRHPFYKVLEEKERGNAMQLEKSDEMALTGKEKLKRFWDLLLNEYTRRDCTNPKDKLRAFGGLAAEFQNIWPEDGYFAGIWRDWLFVDLTWTTDPEFPLRPRPTKYRAPSWSWAAVDSPVVSPRFEWCLAKEKAIEVLEVVDCTTVLRSTNAPFGEVTAGTITVRGYLREGRLSLDDSDDYHEYMVHGLESSNGTAMSWSVSLDSLGEETAQSVWCLWVTEDLEREQLIGLLLVSIERESKFRRVGAFESKMEPEQMVHERKWFIGSGDRRVISII